MADEDDTILVRLRLQNGREFKAELAGAGAEVKAFGKHTGGATREAHLFGEGLMVARHSLQHVLFATGLTAAGVLHLGFAFAEAEEAGVTAFTAWLGTSAAARTEVEKLVDLTHDSGFQLPTLTAGAVKLEQFGFTARAVNETLDAIGNFAARFHLGTGGFDSLVSLFTTIQDTGVLGRRELRALRSNGINAIAILREQLQLTEAQVTAVRSGKLTIPARFALPALRVGMQRQADQVGTNLGQQVGITHSLFSEIFGTGEKGVFGFTTHGLERVNALLKRAVTGQREGGTRGMLAALDPSGTLVNGWMVLSDVVHDGADAFLMVWRVAKPLLYTLGIGAGGLVWILALATGHTGLLSLAFKVLAIWYLITRGRLVALIAVQKYKLLLDKLEYIQVWLGVRALQAQAGAQWALNIAMSANPIAVFIIAVAALSAGLYILAQRYERVREILRDIAGLSDTPGWLNFALNAVPGIGQVRGTFQAGRAAYAGLVDGGRTLTRGGVVVGEGGPELLHLPAAAQVTPLRGVGDRLQQVLQPIVELYIDSERWARIVTENKKSRATLGEANARYRAEVGAHA